MGGRLAVASLAPDLVSPARQLLGLPAARTDSLPRLHGRRSRGCGQLGGPRRRHVGSSARSQPRRATAAYAVSLRLTPAGLPAAPGGLASDRESRRLAAIARTSALAPSRSSTLIWRAAEALVKM